MLFKGIDGEGFVFTNFASRKVEAIKSNPKVSAVFGWYSMHRQLLFEGKAQKFTAEESEQYFHSRPHDSQVTSWSSKQSAPIENRRQLDQQFDEALTGSKDKQVPKPDYWGRYKIFPARIKFWKERSNRMHDRIGFARSAEYTPWKIQGLQT